MKFPREVNLTVEQDLLYAIEPLAAQRGMTIEEWFIHQAAVEAANKHRWLSQLAEWSIPKHDTGMGAA